ncbi:NAD(P)/FAD-dependent oxidoreductase [Pontibacter diazotrophicus]|uniref:NAD(P)/FAD-dependent oxidoreductase n=1 Tax=Pontibacter diazotrophicus TaxID=1400979 RepID=A0A3D8L1L1_9BACT|nr:NAD(P)/FAD-dependent oxidoreductase [Pontibacter diazotrophicus]RDV11311.1 NAD(P)/FAD-dependent oxidoreductase [Pontibacter diazotrophicus]
MKDVVIVGGGLAGLVSALGLAKAGLQVTLVEKKAYPFHKVCGEYVSNEVLPYLQSLGVDISSLKPANISRFLLSSPKGNTLEAKLDLGGFGVSRYTFDHYLYQLAQQQGVQFILERQVQDVTFGGDAFDVALSGGESLHTAVVLGAYGKRTNLDRQLNRQFFRQRSPYIGVKYHIRHDFPKDLIALLNFADGYAGTSAIEDDRYCLCYLTTRENLKKHRNIPAMEQAILYRNPHLRQIFEEAEFLYEQPEVINEITFATKTAVENHMLMCGDAAGMITPLCGNGMAMAIHSGKIATDHLLAFFSNGRNRQEMEVNYSLAWKKRFANRMTVGRTVQRLFGSTVLSEIAVSTLKYFPFATRSVMRQTHGEPF